MLSQSGTVAVTHMGIQLHGPGSATLGLRFRPESRTTFTRPTSNRRVEQAAFVYLT